MFFSKLITSNRSELKLCLIIEKKTFAETVQKMFQKSIDDILEQDGKVFSRHYT